VLATGGIKRLEYKRRVVVNVNDNREAPFFRVIRNFLRIMALKKVFESSEPATKAFANFLITLIRMDGVSYVQIEEYASIFLMSQHIFSYTEPSNLTNIAFIIAQQRTEERDFSISYPLLGKETPSSESIQKLGEKIVENRKFLKEILKSYLNKPTLTSEKVRFSLSQKPAKMEPIQTR